MFFPLSFGYSACGVGVYVEPVSLLEGVGGGWGALTLLLSYWLPSFWVFQHIFVLLTLMYERKRRIFASLWKKQFFWHFVGISTLLLCGAQYFFEGLRHWMYSRAYYTNFQGYILMTWFWHSFTSLFNVQRSLEYIRRR